MMNNNPSLDLVEFVETNILPQYTQFDRAHNLEHVTRVIRNALGLVRTTGADINMVYTIAAYHDLGMSGPRAIHHLTGGKILAADARLKRWFSAEQIKVMKEAVEDHRASASHTPRSLYGKIIADLEGAIAIDALPMRQPDAKAGYLTKAFAYMLYAELVKTPQLCLYSIQSKRLVPLC